MKTLITIFSLVLLLFSHQLYAQYSVNIEIIEPTMPELATSEQPGGRMITSIAEYGQYLRVLIVFVQFKDDNYNPYWSEWPKGSQPDSWMSTNTIDYLINQNSTNQNFTHYFSVMSMGHYKVIGTCYSKITTNTRDEYITMGYKRGEINKQILQQLDGQINYSLYDKWSKLGEYNHAWGADGEVDMIWMVYRNISKDLPNPLGTAISLGFGDPVNGIYSGEA
jgi:hypothetical protein